MELPVFFVFFFQQTKRSCAIYWFQTCFFFRSYIDRKLCHFGQNVSKYRLENTFLASFNTAVRRNDRNVSMTKLPQLKMTEMFQRKKISMRHVRYSSSRLLFTRSQAEEDSRLFVLLDCVWRSVTTTCARWQKRQWPSSSRTTGPMSQAWYWPGRPTSKRN